METRMSSYEKEAQWRQQAQDGSVLVPEVRRSAVLSRRSHPSSRQSSTASTYSDFSTVTASSRHTAKDEAGSRYQKSRGSELSRPGPEEGSRQGSSTVSRRELMDQKTRQEFQDSYYKALALRSAKIPHRYNSTNYAQQW
ncbi:Hypp1377 [Branchiostoma lanceolatum]|uniref:Hypp1377 protein n=1 Tax=Branchiostoma lanceolatum TaxID=7740 RepID=A0A8J9ZJX2_BRALA|nr:Hypp1377 [Branchiostoma lanceolatum]